MELGAGNQAVHRALRALEIVAASDTPLAGAEIGRRLGIHQTSASRLMRSLVRDGYVQEVRGGFIPGLSAFGLAVAAGENYPVVTRYREAITEISSRWPRFDVTLVTMYRGRQLYFLRTSAGHPIPLSGRRFPLHLSAAGLRLLLDRPVAEALEVLERDSLGLQWRQPTTRSPADPEEALDRARRALHGEALILSGWLLPEHRSGAIPVAIGESTDFVLAMSIHDLARSEPEVANMLYVAQQIIADATGGSA